MEVKVSAILLAAGLSGRMKGRNKLLMPWHEKTLISHAYEQLSASEVVEVIVVLGRDNNQILQAVELHEGDKAIFNAHFERGMTSSIQAGVREAKGDAFMICLGDMPMLTSQHYNALIAEYARAFQTDSRAILMPVVNGKRGNPVIFSGCYRQDILNHRATKGCRQITMDNLRHLVEYTTEELAYLTDVDVPEDYDRLIT